MTINMQTFGAEIKKWKEYRVREDKEQQYQRQQLPTFKQPGDPRLEQECISNYIANDVGVHYLE